jgi:hypothetical protein
MEKATLTPFSYRGRGSALRSQKTSWSPLESRLLSEVGGAGGVLFDGFAAVDAGLTALGGCFDFAAFFGGGELHERISDSQS